MADLKRIYWDACIWISFINGDPKAAERCKHLIEQARAGHISIWTSSLSLAEVFRKKCEDKLSTLPESGDLDFEKFIEQDFLYEVQLDHDVGTMARRLLRKHPQLKKPTDAIHLATAVLYDLDEFHTSDYLNLLRLNGSIFRNDGATFLICEPPPIPEPAALPAMPLFEGIE